MAAADRLGTYPAGAADRWHAGAAWDDLAADRPP
jgi:hypothetical protein